MAAAETNTDRQLVRRAHKGERSAFDLLVLRYQHRVAALVRRHLSNEADVEDVTQEVFLRALRGLNRFRGESAFYTWLYRIAINTARNHESAQSRRPRAAEIELEEAAVLDTGDQLRTSLGPEARTRAEEMSRALRQALADLPDDLCTAITLREFDGLSYEQIAEVMACPLGTVRSRIFRARQALSEQLAHFL